MNYLLNHKSSPINYIQFMLHIFHHQTKEDSNKVNHYLNKQVIKILFLIRENFMLTTA